MVLCSCGRGRLPGLTAEEAAKKAQTTPAQLAAWEAGVDYPSIPKLRLLGVAYKRPIAVFYLAEPPKDFAPLKDFRRLPQEGPRRQSPIVLLNERRTIARREAAIELYEEVGGAFPEFDLYATLEEDPEWVGGKLREWLDVPLEGQFRWGNRRVAYNEWRAACEGRGVLAFQTTGVPMRNCDDSPW